MAGCYECTYCGKCTMATPSILEIVPMCLDCGRAVQPGEDAEKCIECGSRHIDYRESGSRGETGKT